MQGTGKQHRACIKKAPTSMPHSGIQTWKNNAWKQKVFQKELQEWTVVWKFWLNRRKPKIQNITVKAVEQILKDRVRGTSINGINYNRHFRIPGKSVMFFSDNLCYAEKCVRISLSGFCKKCDEPSKKSAMKQKRMKVNVTARWRWKWLHWRWCGLCWRNTRVKEVMSRVF